MIIGVSITSISAQSPSDIPSWVKNNAVWWGEDEISDSEFLTSLEFLIENKIIEIPKIAKLEQELKVEIEGMDAWYNDILSQREEYERENRELKELNKEAEVVLKEVSEMLGNEIPNIRLMEEGIKKLEKENQELKAENQILKNKINSQTTTTNESPVTNEQIPIPPKYSNEYLDSSWNGIVTKYLPNQNDLDSKWTMGSGFVMYDKPPIENDGSTKYYYDHEEYGQFSIKISKNKNNIGSKIGSLGNIVEHESIPSYCVLSWSYSQGYNAYTTYYDCVKGDISMKVHKGNLWSGAELLDNGISGTATLTNVILEKLN